MKTNIMETYHNVFDPHEDFMLWELHEVRHALHAELSKKTLEEINAEALEKYRHWQNDLKTIAEKGKA